jgi:hypothetical protein
MFQRKKNYKAKFSVSSIVKKIKSTKIILKKNIKIKNKKNKKKKIILEKKQKNKKTKNKKEKTCNEISRRLNYLPSSTL